MAERPVTCTHCEGEVFQLHHILIPNRMESFLGIDATGTLQAGLMRANSLTCTTCSQVLVFAKQPTPR